MNRPLMINAFDPTVASNLDKETEALIARRQKVLGPSYKLFYEAPVHAVRAEGVWIYDGQGRQYLDVYNNVPSVGHSHPRVVEAVSRQMAVLNTHTRYLYDTVLTYAERLLATFPAELSNVMFTCTGSESADLAMRVAKTYSRASGIIVTENAYHGVTEQIAAMSPSLGEGVPLAPNVRPVRAPDAFRLGAAEVGAAFASSVKSAVADLQRHGFGVAAMMADMIFSSDGVHSHPVGFLKPAVDAVRAAGGLFIADEVQPGFGRLGDGMWGFVRHGVVPDIVVMGKPMGNGLPIGGIVARPEVLDEFARRARYFNTFGGNPVCCAAGLAVLDIIRDEGLIDNAQQSGERMKSGLREIARTTPSIGDVRGAGLFVGVDFVKPGGSKEPDGRLGLCVVNALRERRVLISASGIEGNVLKIRPPLPFKPEHVDLFLEHFADVVGSDGFKRIAEAGEAG